MLFIDPVTGEGRLKNDSADTMELIGYTVLSDNASLLPNDGDWNSLEDQSIAGWDEAAPTTASLSELNALGSLSLAAGESIHLGIVFNTAEPQSGVALEFALATFGEFIRGVAVFSEFLDDISPPAAASASAANLLASDGAPSEPVEREIAMATASESEATAPPMTARRDTSSGSAAMAGLSYYSHRTTVDVAERTNMSMSRSRHAEAFALLGLAASPSAHRSPDGEDRSVLAVDRAMERLVDDLHEPLSDWTPLDSKPLWSFV